MRLLFKKQLKTHLFKLAFVWCCPCAHTHCHWVFYLRSYVWSFYCILCLHLCFMLLPLGRCWINNSYSFTYLLPSLCRFPIPHWHYPCEKRSRLPGQGSRGTSLQVTRQLIHTGKTRPWVSAADNFLGSKQYNFVRISTWTLKWKHKFDVDSIILCNFYWLIWAVKGIVQKRFSTYCG